MWFTGSQAAKHKTIFMYLIQHMNSTVQCTHYKKYSTVLKLCILSSQKVQIQKIQNLKWTLFDSKIKGGHQPPINFQMDLRPLIWITLSKYLQLKSRETKEEGLRMKGVFQINEQTSRWTLVIVESLLCLKKSNRYIKSLYLKP